MADPTLIAAVVANGIEPDEAEDIINRVSEAMVERLALGKPVRIEGVGVLKAPVKEADAGFPPRHRVKRRRVEIKGSEIWRGDAYPDTREKSKITISGGPRR